MEEKEQPFRRPSFPIKKILFNNFLGGLAWAAGATVGFSIIVTVFGFIIKNVNFIPIVGSFASQVVDFVISTNPHLQQ